MPAGSDYVIATGKSATVEDFLKECFSYFNLEFSKFVIQDDRYLRPTEVDALIGDPSKAERELGWTAKTDWQELAKIMCKHEEKLLDV